MTKEGAVIEENEGGFRSPLTPALFTD